VTQPHYLDTLGLWDATAGLPEQLHQALSSSASTLDLTTLVSANEPSAVVVLGMGTAGLAGDVVAAYAAPYARVPVFVGRAYDLPAFVGPETLVFAVTFSGESEETLVAARAALERGARLVVVAGDGALTRWAQALGLPLFSMPDGLPVSRTALGALTVPMLTTMAHLGLVPDPGASLATAVTALRRRRDALIAPGSAAEEVARLIGRTIPLVYGSSGVAAVAARRWKTQVNENAKTPAFFAVQPELSHNEVAGWGQNGDVTRQVLSLITLRHAGEHPQVARRFELVVEATDEVMASVIPVWAEGEDELGRFFDLALFGDFVSLHLAGREGTDPGPVPTLSDVEAALRN
jgi:glucose/mannose-6-phosphate isomerase